MKIQIIVQNTNYDLRFIDPDREKKEDEGEPAEVENGEVKVGKSSSFVVPVVE